MSTSLSPSEASDREWLLENALKRDQYVIPISNAEFIQAVFREYADIAHVTGFPDDPSALPNDRRKVWAGGQWNQSKIRAAIRPEHNNFFTLSVFDLPTIPARPGETEIERTVRLGRRVKPARRRELFKALCYVSIDDVGLPENGGKVTVEKALRLGLPSARIETSPGNWQWGYIVEFEYDIRRAEALLDGLIRNGLSIDGKDPGMKGVTRYQRLPEGCNTKAKHTARNGGVVWRHRVHEWRPDRIYRIEDLAARFGIDLDATKGRAQIEEASIIWPADAPVVKWLAESGSLIQEDRSEPGKYHIVCPWVHEHTNGDQSGTALYTKPKGELGFKCHHGHCHERTALDFLKETGLLTPHDVWVAFGGLSGVVPGVTGPRFDVIDAPAGSWSRVQDLPPGAPLPAPIPPAAMNPKSQSPGPNSSPVPPAAMNPKSQSPGPNSSPVHAQPEGPFGTACTPNQNPAAAGGLDFMGGTGGAGGGAFTGPPGAPGAPAGGGDGGEGGDGAPSSMAVFEAALERIPAEGAVAPEQIRPIVEGIVRVTDPLVQGVMIQALKARLGRRMTSAALDAAMDIARDEYRAQQPGRGHERTQLQEAWAGLDIPEEHRTALNQLARLSAGPGEIAYPFPEDERNPQSIARAHPLNLQAMLNHYGIGLRFDEMSRERIVAFPGFTLSETLKDSASIEILRSIAGVSNMRVDNIGGSLEALCSMPPCSFHPVRDYLEHVKETYPPDGVDYVEKILDALVLDIPEGRHEMSHRSVVKIMLHKWLMQCAAAPYNTRAWALFFRAVLVLVGPQDLGKTNFFRALVPDPRLFRESVTIDTRDADLMREALSVWISELGELDGIFRKHDVAMLKAAISKTHDKIRDPYAVSANALPRRTVFCGSVNTDKYLVDQTGNTRWWSIKVQGIDLELLKGYRHDGTLDRMWAQLRHEVDGLLTHPDPRSVLPPWVLTRNEAALLAEEVKRFEREGTYEELLEERFNWDAPEEQWRPMTSSEVAEALGTRMENIKPQGALKHSIEVVMAKRHAKDRELKSRKVHGVPRRSWLMPPKAPYVLSSTERDSFRDAME